MTDVPGWVLVGFGTVVGTFAGYFGSLWWARRLAKQRRRIPKHWPLDARRMASSSERRVWHWLARVFFDHHVMIKTPVTRFTMPHAEANGAHWHQLLSGVYCTFTICSSEGHVIGCVDVPGPSGISRSNRLLKLSLLSQCGISYCVVKAEALPSLAEIRTEFLGDKALVRSNKEGDHAMITEARQKLRSAVDRRRNQRATDLAPVQSASANSSGFGRELSDSDFNAAPWQQPNSFVAPLDSRRAKLG